MKKQSKSRMVDKELYALLDECNSYDDDRYWGVFECTRIEQKKYGVSCKIDTKRFQKTTGVSLPKQVNERNTHYFYPKHEHDTGYNCIVFLRGTSEVMCDWFANYKKLIEREIAHIEKPKKYTAGDMDKYQSGISGLMSSQTKANLLNSLNQEVYEEECQKRILDLYSMFFQDMVSQFEALLIKVLSRNGVDTERFNRNKFYNYALSTKKVKVEQFTGYYYYDLAYCIWHFIKHNTKSTYETLKNRYPEILISKEFVQGELGKYYIKFSDDLIEETMYECQLFFFDLCKVLYDEDMEEAKWNYTDYFLAEMAKQQDSLLNPLGLDFLDELD